MVPAPQSQADRKDLPSLRFQLSQLSFDANNGAMQDQRALAEYVRS